MRAKEAASVFQEHRDELGFVNTAQCEEKELFTVEKDGEIVGAALANHCVRKPQTTLYELAVLPEYRRQGIATKLLNQLSRDSPHDKLIAKCPVDLPANEFYKITGWTLIETEDGKDRELNVWEYDCSGVDLVTTGRPDLTEYARKHGWLTGTELSAVSQYENAARNIEFLDMDWREPDPDRLISAAMKHKPKYAVAGDYEYREDGEVVGEDIETVNNRAKTLSQWVENPIVVPHRPGQPAEVPDFAVTGYSTPTSYGGTEAPMWEYQGEDVHILGGTMNRIKKVIDHLGDSVRSLDTNTMHRDATQYGEFWTQSRARKKTAGIENDIEEAYENSILNMTYAFEQWDLI